MVLPPYSRNPRVTDPKPSSVITVQYLVERRQEVAVVAEVVTVVVHVDVVHGDVREVLHFEVLGELLREGGLAHRVGTIHDDDLAVLVEPRRRLVEDVPDFTNKGQGRRRKLYVVK